MSELKDQTEAARGGSALTAELGAELYMCRTDYDHELGVALGGNIIYPSVEDLKRSRSCIKECGIVAVRVEFVRVVEEGCLHGDCNEVPNVELTGDRNAAKRHAGRPG